VVFGAYDSYSFLRYCYLKTVRDNLAHRPIFWKREQLAVPKIGQCARLSLTVFELQMCKNYVMHIVPVPAY